MADPTELLALATSLATDAAQLLRDGLDHVHGIDTKSSLTDLVTASDRASERLIVDGIRAARPDDGILGEEGTAHAGTSGVRWVIDPLDGTTNFVYGIPAYSVSIAVEVDGVTEVGVVVDAPRSEVFTAVRGRGAHLDGRPLRCTDASQLATSLVGTGFSYDAARRARQGALRRGRGRGHPARTPTRWRPTARTPRRSRGRGCRGRSWGCRRPRADARTRVRRGGPRRSTSTRESG